MFFFVGCAVEEAFNNGVIDKLKLAQNQQPRPKGAGYELDLNLLVRRNSR